MSLRLTLHEAVSRKFDKRPDGHIFTRDIKTVFSLLVICLQLQEKPKHRSINFLAKHYPFSFTVQEAVATMGALSLNVESSATNTTVSYAIKPDLAISLLRTFMTAKLLHTPADRTRAEPKDKVLLQPTPKGVAIVQSYCKINGIKFNSASGASGASSNFTQCPPIIRTDFNTMDLFLFERSTVTGNIIYSEYFIHLLFTRFMGTAPNVWSPQNSADELPSLEHRLQMDDEFDFSNFQTHSFTLTAIQNGVIPGSTSSSSSLDKKKNPHQKKTKRESPFAHTFFTNPESDSHVQYYVSDKGVRVSQNVKFQGDVVVPYCFSSKSGWQWLMDCTDIMYPSDAQNIFSLFFKYGLIEPIILPPSTASSSKKQLRPSKTAFYTASQKGYSISHSSERNGGQTPITPLQVAHGDEIITDTQGITLSNEAVLPDNLSSSSGEDHSPSTAPVKDSAITIKVVLSDPGMRYLFRRHLELEYCAENLDVYLEIKQFSKKMTILKSIQEIESRGVSTSTSTKVPSRKAIVRVINECLGIAYNIYSSYIAIGAPYQLNIDHLLREQITDAVLQPTTETAEPRTISIALPQKAHIRQSPKASPVEPTVSVSSTNAKRAMNNKNLSIEIPSSEELPIKTQQVMTPTKEQMTHSLQLLQKLFPMYDKVGAQILKMLEFDSFPKFLVSDTLKYALGSTRA